MWRVLDIKEFHASRTPCGCVWIEIAINLLYHMMDEVAPRAGAWIEIVSGRIYGRNVVVAPRAGAWIEIIDKLMSKQSPLSSHPVRVRGLKSRP